MDFRFTEDQLAIQSVARDFAQKRIAPIAAEFDKSGEFPLETIKEMGALGLMGIEVPHEYGGAGLDPIGYALAMIEIAAADCAHSTIMGLKILSEHPYEMNVGSATIFIQDFDVQDAGHSTFDIEQIKDAFASSFERIWRGQAENDGFNRLILGANMMAAHGLAFILVPLMALLLTYLEVWPERALGAVFGDPAKLWEYDPEEGKTRKRKLP